LTDWIDRAVVGESARWGDNRRSTPYTRNNEWLTEVNRLQTEFFPTRRNVVLGQFTGKNPQWYPTLAAPEFYINGTAQYGGDVPTDAVLTLETDGQTAWYTLDGSDPRQPGGTISGMMYTGAAPVTKAIHVKARTRTSDDIWSALAEAVFNVDPISDSLRITELMYHPADPNTEFVELRNIGSETINLNLVEFSKGIDFVFGEDTDLAPGRYALIVQDQAAFEAKYGTGLNVVGRYTGRLDNDGEKIMLTDALGRIILSFSYKDSWYELTDGSGFSLTMVNPESTDPADWDHKYGWRSSLAEGGTPGTSDATLPVDSIVFNELLAHSHAAAPDWIELYNTTNQDINIGGWFLSDDDSDPDMIRKYTLPEDMIIKSHDYLVFTENTSFGDPALPQGQGFGLSEAGETVYLYSGQNGQITGYYQTQQKFDASETDIPFGRYEKAELSGGYDFTRMAGATPGRPNSAPLLSGIIITEIYYNPASGTDYEFVELYNRSGSPVTLMSQVTTEISPGVFVTEHIPWRLEGTGYEFPENVTMTPGEYLLIAKNPVNYNTVSCDVYGPYDGKLDNDGEEIEIRVPGDLEYGQGRYWIPIEKIDYDKAAPWPAGADGQGDSLHRINIDIYGRDYSNWRAASPTPGS
jgi:hypothetical protein